MAQQDYHTCKHTQAWPALATIGRIRCRCCGWLWRLRLSEQTFPAVLRGCRMCHHEVFASLVFQTCLSASANIARTGQATLKANGHVRRACKTTGAKHAGPSRAWFQCCSLDITVLPSDFTSADNSRCLGRTRTAACQWLSHPECQRLAVSFQNSKPPEQWHSGSTMLARQLHLSRGR